MSKHPAEDSNPNPHRPFAQVLRERLSRRDVLRGGAGLASATALTGFGLVGCSGNNSGGPVLDAAGRVAQLGVEAVAKSTQNRVSIPTGYQARVLYALGDPINRNVAAYTNDGSQGDFDQRAGDEHDGMHYFGLGPTGQPDPGNSARGLLVMNHENLEQPELHGGMTLDAAANGGSRPQAQVDKEMNAHGVSIIEIVDDGSGFEIDLDSPRNRRITGFTPMALTGPVAGNAALTTPFTTANADRGRGTLNNCAMGYTPWGTYLTCEENWFSYFIRGDDEALRTPGENELFARYGIEPNSSGFSYQEWDTVAGDVYARFNITAGAASSAATDYRNEPNSFGYIVEIDPFDPTSTPQKRTALGRFGHEGCWLGPVVAGEPLVFYMGDDSRNEYIYKFVTDAAWDPADRNAGQAAGAKYLDAGTLYVATFNPDGSGTWTALEFGQNGLSGTIGTAYTVTDQGDVILGTRIAADAVGATPMDRPEWGAVDPITGEAYLTLTNNSRRGSGDPANPDPTRPDPDAANPRAYTDLDGKGGTGNVNGHIIRWREDNGNASDSFTWDIFLFGAESDADPATVNLSGLNETNDFSSPDGLWFDRRGLLWIQTDDSAYNDVTNDQLLAALPGRVGDGEMVNVQSPQTGNTVQTFVGRAATSENLRRFLVGPQGCEITGITSTPDDRTLFVNVQHPATPAPGQAWPNTSGDATDQGNNTWGRSATIVITRTDGGEIAV